eukprot:353223-Chlamydomonas_euryale.AAC.1
MAPSTRQLTWTQRRGCPSSCRSCTQPGSRALETWPGCLKGLWSSSCCLLKGWWDWVEWSAGHARRGGIGLLQLSAQLLVPVGVGWGWYGVAQDCAQ